jgi:hypothetical protein
MDAELTAALPDRVCGRRFHPRALRIIRETIVEYQHASRTEIVRRVCERLNWTDSRGRLKVAGASVALLGFHRKGWIELPAPRRCAPPAHLNPPLPEGFRPPEGTLDLSLTALGRVRLEVVAHRADSRLWNGLISTYHYQGYTRLCGAQIRYLIHSDRGVLGAMGFSAPALSLRDRDRWIGWTCAQRTNNRHLVVNNSRFLLLPWVRVPNLASHVLARAARRLPSDFEPRYGYTPALLESFVERSRFSGTCYRAANWLCVGQTTGRGRTDLRPRRQREREAPPLSIKAIWLYPLGSADQVRARLCRGASQGKAA